MFISEKILKTNGMASFITSVPSSSMTIAHNRQSISKIMKLLAVTTLRWINELTFFRSAIRSTDLGHPQPFSVIRKDRLSRRLRFATNIRPSDTCFRDEYVYGRSIVGQIGVYYDATHESTA